MVIGLFAGAAILEMLLWALPASPVRKFAAAAVIPAVIFTSVATIILRPSVISVMLALIAAYRICNLLRVIVARMHEQYLRRLAFQSSAWIIGLQAMMMLAWQVTRRLGGKPQHVFLGIAAAGLVAGIVMLLSVIRHVRTTRPPRLDGAPVPARDMPTLTVCIPARNETDDLEACLQSLVASDYPKLEILVLDDCSQNKRTPEIIRGFAHDGVRFIQGVPPEEGWLAKNYAYQRLYEEANGDLLLFCGVDARFQPASLRLLVQAMHIKNKTMLSVIPRNAVPSVFGASSSSLLQPMRYAWELALPRRLFRRPPVLSTCWLVRRDLIRSAGGFAAVSRSIVPESYFARVSTVHDGYTFMRSNRRIGVISDKPFSEQRATAVRTRYPQVHRRIELVLVLTMLELVCVVAPYPIFVVDMLTHGSRLLLGVSGAAIIVLTGMYAVTVALTYRAVLTRSLVLLPIAALFDALLLNYSMVAYEFFTVSWKGRNVCIPVMRVVGQLETAGEAAPHAAVADHSA